MENSNYYTVWQVAGKGMDLSGSKSLLLILWLGSLHMTAE